MGFAGQVFAARVAIGLAIPSAQAMQETGGILAKGAEKIYERLGLVAQQAANRRKMQLGRDLTDLVNISKSNSTLLNQQVKAGVQQAIEGMSEMGRKSLTAAVAPGSYVKLKNTAMKSIGKDLGGKLFAGVSKARTASAKIARMMENIIDLTNKEKKAIVEKTNKEITAARYILNQKKLKLKEMEKEAREVKELTPTMTKNINQQKRSIAQSEIEVDRLKNLQDVYANLTDAVEDLTEKKSKVSEATKKLVYNTRGAAHAIKTGFNQVLRASVGIMTAFYYKLNQNTQELIEFERELLNANSVFNLTNDELFKVGNTITEFGNEFGIAVQNGATGLYQLASAGLTANEAMEVLPHTLKLSMAVQGDHNTISKLTAQTLFGFGMEMDRAAEVTDKFAYAIQKSLIEYQDLSSAVKFALPFFTSTGQTLDQLLGALQVLTNRALEAGIAGRGLRQALSEFAESAMDAEAGFRKLGVEILNSEGEMIQLTEIAAQFAAAVGEDINNTELLVTLIDELNVRGATAFIHLVQASDEFTDAVERTKNAGGELDNMVKIQNESLSAQWQIMKNNVFAIFALRDASYEGTEFINGFHKAVVGLVTSLRNLLIEEVDGKQVLTVFGLEIQNVAINGIKVMTDLIGEAITVIRQLIKEGLISRDMLVLLVTPIYVILKVLKFLGPELLQAFIYLKIIGAMLPHATIKWIGFGKALTDVGAAGMVLLRVFGVMTGIGAAIAGVWAIKKIIDWRQGRQAGGYVSPMAHGGMATGAPYLVGEQGPELFVPGQRGQVLNSNNTRNILAGNFNSGVGMNQNTVIIEKAIMKNTSLGIDSFGGLVG